MKKEYVLKTIILSAFLILASTCNSAFASCDFQQVTIKPISKTDFSLYTGGTPLLTVTSHSDDPGLTNIFDSDDPPIDVRQNSGASCQITYRGIWEADGVFASTDGGKLLLTEYSGSSVFLDLFNVPTCQLERQIEVTDMKWQIKNDKLLIWQPNVTNASGQTLTLCSS